MVSRTDALRVYSCGLNRWRPGRANDGGYVMFDVGEPTAFFSGGIADDNSFERDVLSRYPGLTCEAYDPNSDGGPDRPTRMHFHREPFPSLTKIPSTKSILVKLDIEGDEWSFIRDLAFPDCIAQLIVELHSPHLGRWDWNALSEFTKTHALVHAHANNMDGLVEVDSVRLPGTLETTWIRRDLAGPLEPNVETIPCPLDQPNDPKCPDHVIDWAPFFGWTP